MQLIDDFPPGTVAGGCYLCTSGKRPEESHVVDLERDILGEGFLMICEACARDVAALLGFMPPEKAAYLSETNAELVRANEKLKTRLDQHDDLRGSLSTLLDSLSVRDGSQ